MNWIGWTIVVLIGSVIPILVVMIVQRGRRISQLEAAHKKRCVELVDEVEGYKRQLAVLTEMAEDHRKLASEMQELRSSMLNAGIAFPPGERLLVIMSRHLKGPQENPGE